MNPKAGSGTCTHAVECFTLAWTAGLLAAFLHDFAAMILLFGGCLICMLLRRGRERLLIPAGFLCGACLWLYYDAAVKQPLCAMDGQRVACTGKITDLRRMNSDKTIYTLYTSLNGHHTAIDWYAAAEAAPLQIGDTVTLQAELTKIQPDYRYHTASYQAGFGRYLRIYHAEITDIQPHAGRSLRRRLHDYRAYISSEICAALPPAEAGLFCAMLFGDKMMLSDETAEAFRAAGIAHITVVSGLHLVFFCGVLAWILRRLQCPARLVFLLQIPAICLFILLADPSISEMRAAVMVLLSQSAALFGRRSDTLRSLSIAMFFCTVLTPYVIGSASFWLSVSGVFGIGILAPFLTKHLQCRRRTKDFLRFCCISAAIFPASVLLCGESSLLAPVCNLMILPLCIVIIYIGFALLLTGGLAGFLLPAAKLLCRFVLVSAKFFAQLPFSHVQISEEPLRIIAALAGILLLLLLIAGIPQKQLAAAMLGSAVLMLSFSLLLRISARNELRIAVLGGTKQAAAVIEAEGQTFIADLTDAPRNAQYIARYLDDSGIRRADVLLLRGGKAAAGYQSALTAAQMDSVILPDGLLWRKDGTVCGKEPVCPAEPVSLHAGGTVLSAEGDTVTVTWQGKTIRFLPADGEAAPADAVIRYGGADCQIFCGDTVYSGQNLLLRVNRNGCCKLDPIT